MDTENMQPGGNIARITTGIHRLSSVIGRVSDSALQGSCGFGMSQFRVLWVLLSHPEGVQQNNIASWLNVTESAISRQVGIMKERGLLEVVVDQEDRRSKSIMLTQDGIDFTRSGIELLAQEQAPYFAGMTEDQQKTMITLLDDVFYKMCADFKNQY